MPRDDCSIPCTVGILTYNSNATLERCLRSLDGFCETIIADGGSTDDTLDIAKKYQCKIIQQSRQGAPIEDFSLERNRMLDVASYDWFFYLDSDEIMSSELKEEIHTVCHRDPPDFYVYRVPYQIVSQDLGVTYRSFKKYYQMRLFNKKSGARFQGRAHEKIIFDAKKFPVGTLKNSWLVPLDVQLDFSVYKGKVRHRIALMAEEWQPKGLWDFIPRAFFVPCVTVAKLLVRALYVHLRYGKDEVVPLRYELYRIYSQLFLMKTLVRRYRNVRKQ